MGAFACASTVRQRPVLSKFSSARPGGSIRPWQAWQVGFWRCSSSRARTVVGLLAVLHADVRIHVGRWRGGRSAHDPVEHPGAAQHRRGAIAIGSAQQECALAEQSEAVLVGRASRGGTAEPRTPAMSYCRASASLTKVQSALSRSTTLRFSSSTLARNRRISVSKFAAHRGIESAVRGVDLFQLVEVQPGQREVLDQRVGARILEHALDLRFHDRRVGKPLAGGEVDQLLVWSRVPQEERQARCQFQVAQQARLVGPAATSRWRDTGSRDSTGLR